MGPTIVFCVSGHGYGHATRISALLVALRERAPDAVLHVRGESPAWIFADRDPRARCARVALDPGVLQRNGLDLDLPATLAAHEAFLARWEASLEREARAIAGLGADLVVADIPALACAAARRVGVPAIGIGNFSWDWIFEAFARVEPRWLPLVARYREAYAGAERVYRLPFHGDLSAFPEIVDAPLLVHRSRRSRSAARALVGVVPREKRRLVLVSFGGFGTGGLGAAAAAPDDLAGYLFLGIGAPPPGFSGDWRVLPRPTPFPHEDLVRACDAVLGKPGHSTVAEVIAHRTRFLHLSREDFPENPVLEAGLRRHACSRVMPRADFDAGRWRPHLDALFEQEDTSEPLPTDGARFLAEAILDRW